MNYRYILFSIILLLVAGAAQSQVLARFRANGVPKQNGDTIYVCRGASVSYKDSSLNATSIQWNFTLGSITTSAATLVSVTYNTNGIGSTTLIARNGVDVDSIVIPVKVSDERPTAGFTFTPNGVCGNTNFNFTSTSSGTGLSYAWNFGDGGTSNLANPTHQFLNAIGPPGTTFATVTLTVSNIYGCTAVSTQSITVRNVPDPGITTTNAEVSTFQGLTVFRKCENLPSFNFIFTNSSTTTASNTEYSIDWGDGSPVLTFVTWPATINHTYSQGIHTLTLRVKNTDGCENVKSYYVFLGTNPQGGIPSPGATVACAPLTKTFDIVNTAGNPTGTIYTFIVNDGTTYTFNHPPPASFTHTFTQSSCGVTSATGQANSFSVEWVISNPCEPPSTGAISSIYISDKPRARIAVSPDTVVCTGANITFQNASLGGNEISFSGATSTCTPVRKSVWEVTPATGWTISSGSLGNNNGSNNVLDWTLGTPNLALNFNTPGNYQIKLYTGNKCGVDTTVRTICVRIPPQASFTKPADSSCGPATIDFTNTSPVATCRGDLYNWTVQYQDPLNCGGTATPAYAFAAGSSATSTSPQIQFTRPGRYIITLTVRAAAGAGTCPQASFTDTFVVKGPPRVTLTPPTGICPGNSITPSATASACYSNGPLGYQWTFTGGTPPSSDVINPGPVTYGGTGNYPISITVTDSSCSTTATATDTVRVVNPPAANAGIDKTVCSGDTVRIGEPAVPGITYQWTPATGLSNPNAANPLLTYYYTGVAADTLIKYYVDASAGPTCKGSDTVYITVKRKPVVDITPAAVSICKDSSIVLTASGADSYTWQPGGAATATITVSPSITTSYIVTGQLTGGCSAKDTVVINVSDKALADFTLRDTVYCVPLRLDTVINVTPYPGRNGRYDWYIDGVFQLSNTTGAPPAIPVTTPGDTILIKLYTTSAAGCKPDSLERRLITRPSVTARFTKDTASGCGPLRVQFTNRSTPLNNSIQYTWLFGNGATSTQQQPPAVTYLSSPLYNDTTYYITLKVYAGCDTAYYYDSVKVYPGPSARFSVTPTRGCSPFTFKAINNSLGNALVYYWDFDDGTLDTTYLTTDTLQHTYMTGVIDTFNIRLIAVNNCGRDTQYLQVVVSPSTIQPIIVIGGPSLEGCAPHTAIFTNNSLGAAYLVWNFGDGSPPVTTLNNQSTINHFYASPGTYDVFIRLRNDCSDTTVRRQIIVHPPPQSSFTVDRNLICPNESVTVTSTALNANAWEWLWGDGGTGNGQTATHIYTTPGTYNIRLVAKRVNNFGVVCADTSAPRPVTVLANIPAVIKIDSTNKFCAPFTLGVEAVGAAGAAIVRWTFTDPNTAPGTFIVNGVTASYFFQQPGNYTVKLFTQNAAGCKDSVTKNITIYPTPVASFTPGNLSTCFTDTIVRYTATYTYAWADPISLRWFINGQPVGVGSILTYQFRLPVGATAPYTFNVRLLPQNAAGCGDSTAPATLTIKPTPRPGIKVLPGYVQDQPHFDFTFADTFPTSINYRYTWDMGHQGPLRSEQQFTHRFPDTGTYVVRLLVRDFTSGCTGHDSATVTIRYIPGYLYVPNAFYPDSRKNELKEFKPIASGLETYHLRVYDTWGRILFESRLLSDGKPVEAWNGRDTKGKEMPGDAYAWVIDATYKNGQPWEGMVYDRNPGNGPPPKPTRQGFIRLFR